MKRIVIMQPYYFAWYGFFEQIKLADIYVFYDDVQYIKRSLMSRVTIRTKDGDKWLTIPLSKVHRGDLINEVQTSTNNTWKDNHLHLLKNAYRKAPFANEMTDIVKSVFEISSSALIDVTINAIKVVAHYYGLNKNTEFYRSSELGIKGQGTKRLFDISASFQADTYITGMGALNYLEYDIFNKGDIGVEFINYAKKPYPQLFESFNPYVTILDLIANTGQKGIEYMNSNTLPYEEFIHTDEAKKYLNN